MQRKHKDGTNKCVCFAALCILYVLNLFSDDMKPSYVLGYVYIYLFMLCDSTFFFYESAILHERPDAQIILHSSLIAIV